MKLKPPIYCDIYHQILGFDHMEQGQFPKLNPNLLPDNTLIIHSGGRERGLIRDRNDKLIIFSRYDLNFAPNNALKDQLLLKLLVELGDSKLRDLFHMGVVDVLNGMISARNRMVFRDGKQDATQVSKEAGEKEESKEVEGENTLHHVYVFWFRFLLLHWHIYIISDYIYAITSLPPV